MLGSLASISKSALFFMAMLLLFSSETMKINGDIVKIQIPWNDSPSDGLSIDGGIYPDEFNGLPILSITLDHKDVLDFTVTYIRKIELPISLSEKLELQFPNPAQLVSIRKQKDRGDELAFMNILPFLYDSISEKFYKVEYLEIELKKNASKSQNSNLRTGEQIENSVLATGEWYKIPITKTGVHKLDYTFLKNTGINLAGINPKKIRIYGNGGGMLPQKNSDDRPQDLIENAIMVIGESDGSFDKEDHILFYGQDANYVRLMENGELEYQKNYYSDTSFYFLNISQDNGLRMTELENLGTDQPKINEFDDYIVYEKDEFNIINSGREWYGEKFDFTLTYDFKFDFADLIPDTELSVTSSIMGQTYEEASMDLYVNGLNLGQQQINPIVEGSYLAKGSDQVEEFTINATVIPPREKFTVRMTFNPTGAVKSKANLNFLKIVGKRKLKLYAGQTGFRSLVSTQNAISTFEIEGGGSAFQIWDITNPLKPLNQKFSTNGNNASFGAISADLREYIIFENTDFPIPDKASKIHNQNLHNTANIDFLIITNPRFINEAERLADLRRNHDALVVQVVTTDEIYNEFSSGKQDVTAIRDFIKYVYDRGAGEQKLQNVLLFGKGSFDYKDRIENNTNFVPIYSSRNSLHPINSYSSDDYYGFLDDEEGEWVESYSGDHLMDVGIGRLPIKTIEEAKVIVDKLIHYETSPETFGPWRNELFFIADDGDGNLHQRDADKLSTLIDTANTRFNVNKIYLDAYDQIETSIGESAPEVNAEIARSVEKGGLIFNFTGHGSATRWTQETILNITSASEFQNINRLPLFVTATCEFGRHDNPMAISGAEYLLLNPKGGAIGLLTTGRPVFSSTNFTLNKAFYQNVFQKEDGRFRSLGEVFRRTKNQSLNGSVNRNFSLLADPSMTLAYARDEVVLIADEEAYQPGDTLSALGTVKLKGQVLDINGVINSTFNGSVFATVFDKPSEITTLGNEDQPMKFMTRDNLIFKGEVSVANGEFTVEFIVPKNIVYSFAKGKINIYALDLSQKLDAAGSNIEFVVGGMSDDYQEDNTPPEINLFINDTAFVNRGITAKDLLFLARITDESGIRISKSADGEELAAILDDTSETVLNQYYISEKDTYKQGWVTYPYKGLSKGSHKIRLKAWDIHGNANEAEIELFVVEDENLAIEKLMNFPNPFSDFTQFSFEHNRAGEDLEIMIDIYSVQGKLVKQFYAIKEDSESRVSDLVWDGTEKTGSKLASGIYMFTLSVRSLIDGSKKQANQKLVIIN